MPHFSYQVNTCKYIIMLVFFANYASVHMRKEGIMVVGLCVCVCVCLSVCYQDLGSTREFQFLEHAPIG